MYKYLEPIHIIRFALFRKMEWLRKPLGPTTMELYRYFSSCFFISMFNMAFVGPAQANLISYSVCHRIKIKYDRPRMYIFTYAYDDKDANELYSG